MLMLRHTVAGRPTEIDSHCNAEGVACWINADCCSGRCLVGPHRCGASLTVNGQLQPLVSMESEVHSENVSSPEAVACKGESEDCWINADCCSGRCLEGPHRCAASVAGLEEQVSSASVVSEMLPRSPPSTNQFHCKT